ncbi:MAG TPA: hypothetical protein VFL10_05395 [Ornithinibacter sp.]|nr:hypothetical protein [Ornithinibacter sp.]
MRRTAQHLLRRLAGAAAASGLALAGLVAAAWPASAAACSGSTGVTVVVDTGGSTSTKCASGDPSSALKALTAAGFSVTYPQQYPGSVVCRINGYPSSDPCVRMPPGDAYWAFFHAKRGGSWVYSSSGVASYDPAPGSVVGFRFGSGQQPGIAPPAATKTSTPTPTKTTSKPKPTTSKPKPTTPKPTTPQPTSGTTAPAGGTSPTATVKSAPSATPSASATASASVSPSSSAGDTASASPSASVTDLASAPTSADADDSGPGTLIAGGALVALVAGGAGWAAWKRRA